MTSLMSCFLLWIIILAIKGSDLQNKNKKYDFHTMMFHYDLMILWDQILNKIYLLSRKPQSQKQKSIALDVPLPFLTPFSESLIHTETSACTFVLLLLSFPDGPHLMVVSPVVPLAPSLIFHLLYLIHPPCYHLSACSEKLFLNQSLSNSKP